MSDDYIEIQKADFPLHPLETLDLAKCATISDLTRCMAKTAFGGRALGGGVPRNWAQQVAPWLNEIRYTMVDDCDKTKRFSYDPDDPYNKRFRYGVRICPEPDHWGGLSGCTYAEGVSWGKFEAKEDGARFAEVPCDATIALPILVKAVLERLAR